MSVVAADIFQAVSQLLLGNAALAAVLKDRVRPLSAATTDVLPLMTFEEAEGETFDTMQGSATWEKITLQFHVFAGDYGTAKAILRLMKGVPGTPGILHNFTGVVGDVTIGVARWKGDVDASEAPNIGQENTIVAPGARYFIIFHT
jgi:hypothetical protein